MTGEKKQMINRQDDWLFVSRDQPSRELCISPILRHGAFLERSRRALQNDIEPCIVMLNLSKHFAFPLYRLEQRSPLKRDRREPLSDSKRKVDSFTMILGYIRLPVRTKVSGIFKIFPGELLILWIL